jgi:hypothetical protein
LDAGRKRAVTEMAAWFVHFYETMFALPASSHYLEFNSIPQMIPTMIFKSSPRPVLAAALLALVTGLLTSCSTCCQKAGAQPWQNDGWVAQSQVGFVS